METPPQATLGFHLLKAEIERGMGSWFLSRPPPNLFPQEFQGVVCKGGFSFARLLGRGFFVFPSLTRMKTETSARSCLPFVSIRPKVWTGKY